jgi:hypothetical protein
METKLYKKKIVTTIKEYYELPGNGHTYTNGNGNGNGNGLYTNGNGLIPGLPAAMDSATFIESITSYFESYGRKMQNMINQADGSEEALSAAEEEMFRDVWTLSTIVRPYYSAEFAEKLTQLLRGFALSELQVISLLRSGLDIKGWTDFRINNLLTTDMSIVLSTYNNAWNQAAVKSTWIQITSAWNNAIKAKHAKDQAGYERNITQANNLLASFGSLFARGIIQQYPESFFASTPTA